MNFFGNLELETSIDNNSVESARATGDIVFKLIDRSNNKEIDFFKLPGNVTTPVNNDFIANNKSDNVILDKNTTIIDSRYGGNQ